MIYIMRPLQSRFGSPSILGRIPARSSVAGALLTTQYTWTLNCTQRLSLVTTLGDTRKTWMDGAPLSTLSRGISGGLPPLGGTFPLNSAAFSPSFNNRGISSTGWGAREDQRSWRAVGTAPPPPPAPPRLPPVPPPQPLNMLSSINPTNFNLSSMSRSLLPPRPPPTHFVSTSDILTGTQRLATRVWFNFVVKRPPWMLYLSCETSRAGAFNCSSWIRHLHPSPHLYWTVYLQSRVFLHHYIYSPQCIYLQRACPVQQPSSPPCAT